MEISYSPIRRYGVRLVPFDGGFGFEREETIVGYLVGAKLAGDTRFFQVGEVLGTRETAEAWAQAHLGVS